MFAVVAAAGAVVLLAEPASAEMTKCRLTYNLKGWSILYSFSEGTGRISCTNGQAADVAMVAYGGGPAFGRQRLISGKGTFSGVEDISDLYGGYAEAAVYCGAGGAVEARGLMKSNVSLTLSGTGQGINLGIVFGSFSIRPATSL